jgi:hypothetical protein
MATNAALGTAELLICILQKLDINTLLLAHRVSHQWCTVIQSSPELQEKLFYMHRPKPCERKRYFWTPLKRRFELREPQGLPDNAIPLEFTSPRLLVPIRVNPLLTVELLPLEPHLFAGPADQGQRIECVAIGELLRTHHGSWQSMLLSRPPTSKVIARSILLLKTSSVRRSHRVFTVEDPSGVKMSLIVDEILSIAQSLGFGSDSLEEAKLNQWELTFPSSVDFTNEHTFLTASTDSTW